MKRGTRGALVGVLLLAWWLTIPVVFLVVISSAGATQKPCGPAGPGQVVSAGNVQAELDGEQMANAAAIVGEVAREGLSRHAAVIALATAAQESTMRNLHYGDLDSLGLFQQRPAAGYSASDAVNPPLATAAFLRHLLAVPGWAQMPVWLAAAETQRPREDLRMEYAKWEGLATTLAAQLWPAGVPVEGAPTPSLPGGTPAPAGSAMAAGCTGGEGSTVVGEVGTEKLPSGVVLTGSEAARKAAQFAIAQLGKPYVFGANGPDAWDCSSLMQAAWASAGVALPRTTYVQVGSGTPVSIADARTGDLVFIPGSDGTAAAPGHVGMILGTSAEGALLIIQAPQSGENVKISSAASWSSQIVAVRRVG